MKKMPLALSTGVLGLSLALSGCADATPPQDDSAPSAQPSANAADEMFVTMMIPHHRQAITMSEVALSKDVIDPRIAALAQQIKDAQGPEIETMRGWLDDWGLEEDAMGGMDHGSSGDGMMSDDGMAALEAADAETAGLLFLEQMIVHHEGAVQMVEDVLDAGQDPDVLELARRVIDDQAAEIATMRSLIDELS